MPVPQKMAQRRAKAFPRPLPPKRPNLPRARTNRTWSAWTNSVRSDACPAAASSHKPSRTECLRPSMAKTRVPTRTENDTFGPIEVPADRYWGAQAQRSLGNFKIGVEKQPLSIVRALGIVKRAAAETNME